MTANHTVTDMIQCDEKHYFGVKNVKGKIIG